MEASAYKRLQEAWVSDNGGSTPIEPLLVMLPLPLMVFITSAWHPRNFLLEFILIILPLTFNMTALSSEPGILPFWLMLLSLVICFYKLFKNLFQKSYSWLPQHFAGKQPWITNFRVCTYLLTVISIFAVDLNIFPRKLAKTETHGYGAMDLGTGFYIVCNGLVHKPNRLKKELKDAFILVILGIIRLLSVTSVDYQQHVSEYGVHWNFFFTLAGCRLITSILPYYTTKNYLLLAFICGTIHHSALHQFKLKNWVLGNSPRDTFLNANREGIISLCGYITIFYATVAFSQYQRYRKTGPTIRLTIFLCLLSWVATIVFDHYFYVSRRLCNLGYILWTLAMSTSVALVLMVVDILLQWASYPRIPSLFNAINTNGLFFFLLANLATGFINLKVQTLLLSTFESYCLLFGYVIFVTSITYIMFKKGIHLL